MNSSIRTGTPLRQRMIYDMQHTHASWSTRLRKAIFAVCKLAGFLRRSPDSATVEDQPA